MPYWFIKNLTNAWQVGTNPTVTYDQRPSSGKRWNVPVGPFASKPARFGKVPAPLRLGVEYSVVGGDDLSQEAQVKLKIIPVTSALVEKAIIDGGQRD